MLHSLTEEVRARGEHLTDDAEVPTTPAAQDALTGRISHGVGHAEKGTLLPNAPQQEHEALYTILSEQRLVTTALVREIASLRQALLPEGTSADEVRLQALEVARDRAEVLAEALLRTIEDHRRAIQAYRRWRPFERMRSAFAPRLGVFYQYPPRSLYVPPRYLKLPPHTPSLRLSIVTPSRNQGAFIERTLRSVLEQQYPHLEYIVQDNASSDNTLTIMQRYGHQFKHLESTSDDGFASGINRGFKHATGDVMAYLNSDDVLLAGALHYVTHYFEHHPDIDVVYSHRVIIDEYDAEVGRWILPPHDDETLSWADYVPQETLFWRRSIWEKSGAAIDESFRFAIDWDLLLRFRAVGARMARLPRFLGAFRLHPHQKISSEMEHVGLQEMDRLRARCHHRAVSDEEAQRAVQPYLRRHIWYQKLYALGVVRY